MFSRVGSSDGTSQLFSPFILETYGFSVRHITSSTYPSRSLTTHRGADLIPLLLTSHSPQYSYCLFSQMFTILMQRDEGMDRVKVMVDQPKSAIYWGFSVQG